MSQYTTYFGSLKDYQPGGVNVVQDNPKNYVFSNVFEVADKSAPYERVAVAKNFEYAIEAIRAEGTSDWYTCAHDEFPLCMDGEVEIEFVKLADPDSVVDPESAGAHKLSGDPKGQKMGRVVIRRGHQALLPVGAAYRFKAAEASVLMIQTVQGPETVEKWADICQTEA